MWELLRKPIIIPSGEEWSITLILDTFRYQGEKKNEKATITFFRPASGEHGTATILVQGGIRADIVLKSGLVDFGSVYPNTEAEQRMSIDYTGHGDWRILSAKCDRPHMTTEIVEKSRGNGLVSYELIVKLKDTMPVSFSFTIK